METLTKHGHDRDARAAAATQRTGSGPSATGGVCPRCCTTSAGRCPGSVTTAEAVPVLQEAIDVAGRAGVYNTVQWATADLGLALLALGRVDEAADYFTRAGTVSDQVGDDAGKILATYGEAVLAQRQGEHATARTLFATRVRRSARDSACGWRPGWRWPVSPPATSSSATLASARDGYQRLLDMGESWGEVGLIVDGLEGLARAAAAEADYVRAAELLGRAGGLREIYERPATPSESAAVEPAAAAARSALGERSYAEASRRGAGIGLAGAG